MSEWIEHNGRPMPVDGEILVKVKFRKHEAVKDDFITDTGAAWLWDWHHDSMDDDIVAYRIIATSEAKTEE